MYVLPSEFDYLNENEYFLAMPGISSDSHSL